MTVKKWMGLGITAFLLAGGIAVTQAMAATPAPATPPENCPAFGGQGYRAHMMQGAGMEGRGQAFMAERIAKLANKPVEEVLQAKTPGTPWLAVAEKFGVTQEQLQQTCPYGPTDK